MKPGRRSYERMRCGASGERFKRKGRETLPGEAPQTSAIAAAPWISAALAEIGDGIGLVRLAGGAIGRRARGVG